MVLKQTGFTTALLGGVLAVLHYAPGYVTSQLLGADTMPFPGANTTAEAIVLAQAALDAGAFLVGTVGVFLLGYWTGGSVNPQRKYRDLVATFGFGGLLGYSVVVAAFLVYVVLLSGGPFYDQPQRGALTALLVAGRTVGIAVQFALVGIAGAAVATFIGDD